MKKILLSLLLIIPLVTFSQVTTNPSPIEIDQPVTITVDITAGTCNTLSNPAKVYAHLGIGDDGDPWGFDVKGNWGMDDGVGEMTDNGDDTWSITITPNVYFTELTAGEEAAATKMGMVFRNSDGTEKLDFDTGSDCGDFFFDVGSFQATLTNPTVNSVSILNSGDNLSITATNTGGNANYVLKANGNIINSQSNIASYSYTHTNITSNQNYELEITLNTTTITKKFSVIIDPGTSFVGMPAGLVDGINYNSGDPTKATLVLDATFKDFIYVAGSFNNWQPDATYAMKKDFSGKFWLELTGLASGDVETYQYWVVDKTPIVNSPQLVKTADPYSTLVLSPFDDPWIPATTYPGLTTTHAYPAGQEREVTVLQTGQTAYPWVVPNFTKPKKEDLIIYEVLIRDFDADRNFQDLIDKVDYFKNLNINAIELMPVMEFEGNESWGYNTAFHMALDKFYGTENKFKELIDIYHQNGIAVILDIALNHAFGRNPMNRMWMNDPDNDGWGDPSSENPYFNETATHSYSVGSDFNHQSTRTQNYVERVVKHWIEEFKIDGFRWDLTKGFTQNCTGSDSCTDSYQQDRVDILKDYADYSWNLDADHYVIFEHLGGDTEEQEWANYKLGEGKGIMMWSEMFNAYKNLAQGNSSNIDRMGHTAHGFTGKRTLGYPESHDKDRLMYEMVQFGNSGSGYDVRDLNTALSRMSAIGAVTIPIPGPKMVWHFADLGMDNSIWLCSDGVTVNSDYDGGSPPGDCKLDTKPQPQWAENWLGDANRSQIYSDWARLNWLKINEPVFEGDYAITSGSLTPRIDVFDTSIPDTELKNVIILANFGVSTASVNTSFPVIPGVTSWFDLMDETGSTTISSAVTSINLPAGEFRIYGNQASTLGTKDFETNLDLIVYPNPVKNTFSVNKNVSDLKVFDLTGKLVKEFKGDFSKGETFDISTLTRSLYILKITNNSGQQQATKLVKL